MEKLSQNKVFFVFYNSFIILTYSFNCLTV